MNSESVVSEELRPDLNSIFYSQSFFFKFFKIGELVFQSFELVIAIFLTITLLPLISLVSIAIKFFMGGNIFYTQTRVGKNGVKFLIYKFRTMYENAEANSGAVLATENDPRITKLGKFLRSSHLDELPQLLNVLRGEMSFFGPRPERPEFVEIFVKEIENYHLRFDVRPGITGVAQICLPYDAKARDKINLDIFYIKNRESLLLHLIIIYYTILKMITALAIGKSYFSRSLN